MVTLLNTVEDTFARDVCRDHGDKPDELLEILHAVQHKKGYLPDSALRTIAQALNMSRADIHGVVSFYHDYKRAPQAKVTLKICRAEACQAVGAEALIREAEVAFGTKLDAPATEVALEAAYCLGNCALGPAVLVDDDLYGRVDIQRLKHVSMKHREGQTK
ncbi:NAD(P)H-dependent oxidoreductase subunit E [Litorimonas sp. RW-G-Af-16]|uniref:NAD(P)H-dependent oxidoreductase subunit E n=1 Tax=Litorimonas sp. RW-G-Af-16 TaxID=3241168 RepID=UPI00390C4031